MAEGLCHILCGSFAGAVGKVFEYPFDTTKVRLQAQDPLRPKYTGAIDCLVKTARDEGFLGLFKGISPPMVGAAAENAVLFYTFAIFSPWASKLAGGEGTLSAVIAGCGSGIASSFVLTPIELIKCNIQVTLLAGKHHRTIPQHIANIWKRDGIRGFFNGQTGTLLREAGGSAAWFGAYKYVTVLLAGKDKEPTVMQSVLAGACAGISYNLSLFPADTVKSVMQTDAMMGRVHAGFMGTLLRLYRTEGLKTLYRGCGITCARAAPSSAIIFVTFDQVSRMFGCPGTA